jgi:hypothetical protein
MRLSTASLILAYVTALAVHAAPTGESGLSVRSTGVSGALAARGVSSIHVREPKKGYVALRSVFLPSPPHLIISPSRTNTYAGRKPKNPRNPGNVIIISNTTTTTISRTSNL